MHRPFELPAHVADRILFRRGRLHGYEQITPATTALIVIDMQNVFCAPGAVVEVPFARDIAPNINRLAHATRAAGGLVAWVQMTVARREEWPTLDTLLTPGMSERVLEGVKPGSEGNALWPAMESKASDLFVAKKRYSAFLPTSSDIANILRGRGIDTVMVVGTLTNVCCESSARDASMQDFKTFMVSDANAALTEEAHAGTLTNFIQTFGDVRTTDEMIGLLQAEVTRLARRA